MKRLKENKHFKSVVLIGQYLMILCAKWTFALTALHSFGETNTSWEGWEYWFMLTVVMMGCIYVLGIATKTEQKILKLLSKKKKDVQVTE